MIRQILASIAVLAAAALAWLFFAPGASQVLTNAGIVLPFGPQVETANAAPGGAPGGGQGNRPGGQGGPPGAQGGGRPGGFTPRASNVITTGVSLVRINDALAAIGEGTPVRSVTVAATSGGELTEVLVRPGDVVDKGAIIARFDDAAEQIAYDGALLSAEDARTTLARTITSPIAGRVGLIRVTPGNYVAAQTTVTSIDDTSSVLIDFWVPERYAAQIDAGMPVTVNAVALPGQTFTGDVSAIDTRIDPASRTLQVQAEIPNPDGVLRAGMSFTVSVGFPGEEYPAVNPLAILWSAEGSYVWKYVDGKASRVMAEIIQRNSDGVLVRADLKPGDAIITEGILQLSDGASVTLLEGPDGSSTTPAKTPPVATN